MWEHKAKSLIIGTLLVLGVLLIIVGNAMMDSAADGLRRGYIESFTGDVMVSAKSDSTFSIFGAESMDMSGDTEIPTIPDYDRIMERLRNDPRVLSVTGMATAYSLLSADREEDVVADSDSDSEGVIFALVFGVDPETYFRTFPAATIEEGRLPEPGEQAVLLTAEMREKLEKKYKHDFKLGDKILINGFSNAGMRIREVSLVGIYKRGEFMEKAPFIITDIDTVRVLSGLTMSADEQVTLSENQTNLLSSVNPDDIFSDDAAGGSMIDAPVAAMDTSKLDSAAGLLGDTSRRELLNAADTGAWHFILVRLNNSIDTAGMMGDLEKWGAAEKVDLRVTDWKGAAGMAGRMADFIRVIFVIAILVIAIVAVIIIMNTLVISVIERTAEIGTMRALGAQRSFVRRMFLTETLTQTVFFGLLGASLAVLAMTVLNLLHIPLENSFARLLLGGKVLHLVPSLASLIGTLVAVFLVGWLAHLYPVSIALKVQPVKAMQSE
jgi:ABC-type transport system, involved in lipoprotein release, permease component